MAVVPMLVCQVLQKPGVLRDKHALHGEVFCGLVDMLWLICRFIFFFPLRQGKSGVQSMRQDKRPVKGGEKSGAKDKGGTG